MTQTYTLHDLKALTVAELRDIAKDLPHDAVQGYSQMNKEHLIPAICAALGIDLIEHHRIVGVDKPGIKAQMRTLKAQRSDALERGDHDALKSVRRHLHRLNHQLRSHMQ